MTFNDAIIEQAKNAYDEAEKPLNGLRAWDICHNAFGKKFDGNLKKEIGKLNEIKYLSLHLGMYLANWGMYRGSAFIRDFSYEEYVEVVKILVKSEYQPLRDIELSKYTSPNSNELKLLLSLYNELKECFEKLKNNANKAHSKDISTTLITKILLGTLGCIPAYDTYVCKALSEAKNYINAQQTFPGNGKNEGASIVQLANFYCNACNFHDFETSRADFKDLVNTKIIYPQAKWLDMGLFGIGETLRAGYYFTGNNIKEAIQYYDDNKKNLSLPRDISTKYKNCKLIKIT